MTPTPAFMTEAAAVTSTVAPAPTPEFTPTAKPLPEKLGLAPEDWKNWPVLPIVTQRAREIYQCGQELGNDPHAFSVFGDCRSNPQTFLGEYETNPDMLIHLPPTLQETVFNFAGSLNRYSPTVRAGTAPAGLLWPEWHMNQYGCQPVETPVGCELRIHNPSIVIVNLGLDWGPRDQEYLRAVLQQLMNAGVVPILVTKADNWEGDDHVNFEIAALAAEFDLPLWNFWLAVDDLPNRGLTVPVGQEWMGEIVLTDEAFMRYHLTGLQALEVVWRAVAGR